MSAVQQDPAGTSRVRPWGKDQGAYVLINTNDLDPAVHVPWVEPAAEPKPAVEPKKRARQPAGAKE